MYAKAKSGQIAELTGVSAPYEIPENPELAIDTATRSVDECVQEIMSRLGQRLR